MNIRFSHAPVLFILLALGVASVAPALVERMPLERLTREADLIVSARVLSTESRWVPEGDGRNIYTTLSLQPGRVLKGTLPAGPLMLRLPGGTVGEITQTVSDVPVFRSGEDAVLFLRVAEDRYGLVGAFQGRFPVRDGRVRVEGIEVDLVRFQNAVEQAARDDAFDLYGALLKERPVVESAGTASPLELARLAHPPAPPELPGRAATAAVLWALWDYEADYDGDGYVQLGKFYWDVNVLGSTGSLVVYDKIYWRLTGTTAWSLLYTTPVYTITGSGDSDARVLGIYGGPAHEYDFRIETYREGATAPDDYADPSTNEWATMAFKMEPPADDAAGSGPMIIEMQPEKASAGTGTLAHLHGIGMGNGSGDCKVEFYFEGRDRITVLPISSTQWTDSSVTVKVPIGTVDGYPGSAATGPVNVYDAAGGKSPNYEYHISFGYGGRKWPGTHPTVGFYVGTNISSWTDAITAAGATWGAHGNIDLTYAGTTERTAPTGNDRNEVMYSKLDSGVIGQATYWSSSTTMKECDLVLNSLYNWSTADPTPSGAYDVHSITLHEMGHWLTLRDLYGGGEDRDKVMYGYGNTGANGMKREPHPDDAAGVAWIYGFDAAPQADFAWFSGRPEIGASIQFQDESSLKPTAWSWDFGDGSTSTAQNPDHAFLFSGTFPVTLTVSNEFGTSTATKQIIIYGSGIIPPVTTAQPYTYLLPAAAKAQGAGGSNWLSDVVIYNPGSAQASVYCYFLQSGQDNTGATGSEVILPAFRFVRVGDIVGSMFRQNLVAGALLVASSQPLAITSRTYDDQGDKGTYGQFIPAALASKLLKTGEEGYLLHLTKNAGYRTNTGLVNAGPGTIAVNLAFYKADKTLIGTKSYTLLPYQHLQEDALGSLTSALVDDAYAVATCATAGAVYTAYASVADNSLNDPIYIPFQRKSDIQGQAHQLVAAAARTKGGFGSDWRTDLRFYNPFASQSVTLTYVAGGVSTPATFTIGQGELVSQNDILTALFPSVVGNTSGALHVQSTQGLMITSRTYTTYQSPEGKIGTFGQFIPARGAAVDLVASGETGLLLQLINTAEYRTNVGFSEYSGQETQVQVKLYDANRSVLGFKTYTVPAKGNYQVNIFSDLGITSPYTAAMAEVKVLSGGAAYAYASVVDNRLTSNDPIFIPAQK